MKSLLVCLLLVPVFLSGQAPTVTASWDTARNVAALSAQAARLKPMLEQMTPQQWVAGGAPQTYVTQWQSAQAELEYLAQAADLFGQQPEKLTAALDTYFRLQAVEWRLESLIEAVRRYQNPAVGDLILAELRQNSSHRDGLRQYIMDLAAQKEQEFTVVDQEAQRCRAQVLQPTAIPRRTR
jgi:hypothetical protein